MTWVVDASVAGKWLAPEADSALAEALLDDELAAPDLLYVELANLLWKKRERGEIEESTARLAARWLLQVPIRVHDTAGLMEETLSLALRLGHPTYDCCYLALARREGVQLITADRRLYTRCRVGDAADLAGAVVLLGAA